MSKYSYSKTRYYRKNDSEQYSALNENRRLREEVRDLKEEINRLNQLIADFIATGEIAPIIKEGLSKEEATNG